MGERVAIVVGAGGELGRATAEKLAAAGFTVVGTDRSEKGPRPVSSSPRTCWRTRSCPGRSPTCSSTSPATPPRL
jgi:NAD(P)-dependent dehydrogenase (short-subunit alcohol dehydrogenase family)